MNVPEDTTQNIPVNGKPKKPKQNKKESQKEKPKNNYYSRSKVYDNEIIVAAADLETDGLGGELLMIQFGVFSHVQILTGENMVGRFFEAIKEYCKPVIWYFHFGQYDWRYFLDYFVEMELPVDISMRTDTDIYQIAVHFPDQKKPIILRDSYAIWPHPLKDLSSNFCPELPKLEIDIENFDATNPEHIRYAKRDVEILLKGLPRMFDYLQDLFDVTPGATVAGTALRAWQKTLAKDEIYSGSEWGEMEQYIRNAYYGGLVFLTSTKVHYDCETYDINSSYPASMLEFGVPYGRVIKVDDYVEGKMGIYRCRVRAPDNLKIPILPGRNERGAMRWYAGEFETQVTSSELIFAAKHGYEILEIYDGIIFEETVYPFVEFISKCKIIRKAYKGDAREMLAKLMQNGLYGKYGSKRQRTRMFSIFSDESLIGCSPVNDDGKWYTKNEFAEDMLCLPQWAVFITAHSRLNLLKAAYDSGVDNCIYGDTDSLTLKQGHSDKINIGSDYGQFKLEKTWQVFRAIAPKVYTGILDNGEFKGAAKGMPKKAMGENHWRELLEDGYTSASTPSLSSLRVSFKKGVQPAKTLERKSTNISNSPNYKIGNDGDIALKSVND